MKKVATFLFVLLCSISLTSLAQPTVIDSSQQKINLLSSKISWHPSEPSLLLERGKLFMQEEKFDSAVGDFSLCYKRDSINPEIKKLLAKAICKQENFNLSSLNKALSLDSSCTCAKIKVGVHYLYARKIDSALYFLQHNLEDTFAKTTLVTDVIGTWFFTDSNYVEALHYLKSSNIEIESMKALSHYYLGNYQQALVSFDKLEKDSIQDTALIFARAKCYQKTGELEKAMVDFERLQKFGFAELDLNTELRITQTALFISKNWYYLLGIFFTLIAFVIFLTKILRNN